MSRTGYRVKKTEKREYVTGIGGIIGISPPQLREVPHGCVVYFATAEMSL